MRCRIISFPGTFQQKLWGPLGKDYTGTYIAKTKVHLMWKYTTGFFVLYTFSCKPDLSHCLQGNAVLRLHLFKQESITIDLRVKDMEVFNQGARMVMITITYLIFLVFKRKCVISIS